MKARPGAPVRADRPACIRTAPTIPLAIRQQLKRLGDAHDISMAEVAARLLCRISLEDAEALLSSWRPQ